MRALLQYRAMIAVLALTLTSTGYPQAPTKAEAARTTAAAMGSVDVLKGTWVRPDGGYRIVIQGIEAGGKLNAMYFNPSQLPFAKAQVSQEGSTFRVVLVLQAGGYGGSTYDLVYEPATDRLKGTFDQVVARQKFEVFFVRK